MAIYVHPGFVEDLIVMLARASCWTTLVFCNLVDLILA
jgi:hypothetical protein